MSLKRAAAREELEVAKAIAEMYSRQVRLRGLAMVLGLFKSLSFRVRVETAVDRLDPPKVHEVGF